MVYADEADVLNVALFGHTAVEWRKRYSRAPGNMRDHANIYQLIVLSNLESYNAEMVKRGLDQRSAGSAQPSSSRAALAVAPLRCGRGVGKRQDGPGARTTSCFVTIY